MLDALTRAATCLITCGGELSTGYLVAADAVLATRHGVLDAILSEEPITVRFAATVRASAAEFGATVLDYSEDLDACLLRLNGSSDRPFIPLSARVPREGGRWLSFGYPRNKTLIGHRLAGAVSQVLPTPTAKVDLDLSVDPDAGLEDYHGISGAAVMSAGNCRGMVRVRMDGTIGAISIRALAPFLAKNGVPIRDEGEEDGEDGQGGHPPGDLRYSSRLAERDEFQAAFEAHLLARPGAYIFLEGAHGIGKTTFCNAFVPFEQSLVVLGTYSVIPPHGGSNAYTRSQPEVFFDWLCTTVGTLVFGSAPRQEVLSYAVMAQETQELLGAFSEHCRSRQQHGLFFIDGLSEIRDADPALLPRFLGLLPDALPPHVTVVLTSPGHSGVAATLSGRVHQGDILSLPPLTADACESYCWRELRRSDPTLINKLCTKAQGHPLYLQYLIRHANDHTEDDELDDFPVLGGSIEEYYERIWEKLLGDPEALALLGLVARLRPGLAADEFSKALTGAERAVLLPTLSRIRHLLATNGEPALYHASFAAFLISKTADAEQEIQTRLGAFCGRERSISYCVFNVVYHQLQGDETSRLGAVTTCSQPWVDECVARGVKPDALIADVRAALETATRIAPPGEAIRLLLLTQRVEFRYDTLLAQSADLMAGALIALGRFEEALSHVIRYGALVADVQSATRIALTLLGHGQYDLAFTLFDLVRRRCLEAYSADPMETLADFVEVCEAHMNSCLFLKLTGREAFLAEALRVRKYARNVLEHGLSGASADLLPRCLAGLDSIPLVHALCFYGAYIGTDQYGRIAPGQDRSYAARVLMHFLFGYGAFVRTYQLPRRTEKLEGLFADISRVLEQGEGGPLFASGDVTRAVIDELIRLGAPSRLISRVEEMRRESSGSASVPEGELRSANGVDADFGYLYQCAAYWRATGFLDTARPFPLARGVEGGSSIEWLQLMEETLYAMALCEGRLRRAVADGDEPMRTAAGQYLVAAVLPALRFSLAQRADWERSYGLPEAIVPALYERAAETLVECYGEGILDFLSDLERRSSDQLGLYSEGFRATCQAVVRVLQRSGGEPASEEALRLLGRWRDHVLGGVENRHELVPELLALIPAFARAGAHEEAERLFQQVLHVSMGPSWYKENQFALMTTALQQVPVEERVGERIAAIAGCLEHASGEMTFGRYVRHEKSTLIGILFAKRRFRLGCEYYARQTCASREQLASEWDNHTFDAPTPRRGGRHVGSALEEQEAVLEMVRHAGDVPWRLRWALLEVFQLGDRRHIEAFATEFANVVNEAGAYPDAVAGLAIRMERMVASETEPAHRSDFVRAFRGNLYPQHLPAFAALAHDAPADDPAPRRATVAAPADHAEPGRESGGETEAVPTETLDLYMPGLFGRQNAIAESDLLFDAATR